MDFKHLMPQPGEVMEDEAAFSAAMGVKPLFEDAPDIPRETPNPLVDAQMQLSYDPNAGHQLPSQVGSAQYDDEAMKQAMLQSQADYVHQSEALQEQTVQENEAERTERAKLLEGDDYEGA